jgi:hypothetical protein
MHNWEGRHSVTPRKSWEHGRISSLTFTFGGWVTIVPCSAAHTRRFAKIIEIQQVEGSHRHGNTVPSEMQKANCSERINFECLGGAKADKFNGAR